MTIFRKSSAVAFSAMAAAVAVDAASAEVTEVERKLKCHPYIPDVCIGETSITRPGDGDEREWTMRYVFVDGHNLDPELATPDELEEARTGLEVSIRHDTKDCTIIINGGKECESCSLVDCPLSDYEVFSLSYDCGNLGSNGASSGGACVNVDPFLYPFAVIDEEKPVKEDKKEKENVKQKVEDLANMVEEILGNITETSSADTVLASNAIVVSLAAGVLLSNPW